jgi:hypothetical protein
MSSITHQQLLELHQTAVASELYRHRDVLLTGLDRGIVAGLPVGLAPSAQLLSDLGLLNEVQLTGRPNPLGTWLANAIALAGSSDAATVLRRVAGSLGTPHPESSEGGDPPGTPGGLEGSLGHRAVERPVESTETYQDRWRRAELAQPGLSFARAAVLYVLSNAKRFLDSAEIARLSGVPTSEVLSVIDEWRSFLCSRRQTPEESRYFIEDHGFRTFLYWQDDVQAAGVEVSGARTMMADSLSVLFGEE